MKNVIIFMLLIVPFFANGQKFGLKLGMGYSKIHNLDGSVHPMAGAFIQTKGNIYFSAEVNYKGVGGTVGVPVYNNKNIKSGEIKKTLSFQYLEVPIMVGAIAGDTKLRPFISAGPYAAYLVRSKYDTEITHDSEKINFGFVVSPGLMMSEKVSLEARITKSLSPINGLTGVKKAGDYTSIFLMLGYRF